MRFLARHLLEWYSQHGRYFPWRSGASDWEVLLAEILLRQTDAARVVPVFEQLRASAPTPAALAAMDAAVLESLLKPLGLYRQRAGALLELASAVERTGGRLPRQLHRLQALPHVGPYAAGAVTVFARGGRAPLPDVNTSRLGARYFGIPLPSTKPARMDIAKRLLRACPRGLERDFHYAVLDFSQAVCRPIPRCAECPLRCRCRWFRSQGQTAGR